MALTVGQKLGPYEILASIGAGGMGEVYRARDERLKRDVAIKVLPATYSSDADRLRRFEQEAQAAGALNHPNITAVYDIGSHDGAPYIVQELLEGETLRSRLAAGAFMPRRAIGHALQIASGLAAAHTKGIVHRDLKPENIFVTSDGRVKILDFGLAKLTQPEGSGSSATSLPTAAPGTEPGLVMGTVGYMSPEQVRGKFIDARSDIFSFGTILYEMLAGKRAFHGDTTADTMSAILTKEPPDLSETNRRVPESLDRIVRHCLEKSPEARFQSASDIAFDLETMSGEPLSSGAQSTTGRRSRGFLLPVATAAAILLALAAGALVLQRFRQQPASPQPIRFSIAAPPDHTFNFGTMNETGGPPALSPDGRWLAFTATDSLGRTQLWLRAMESTDSGPLPGTENAAAPFWSPDSRSIAFLADQKIKRVEVSGGSAEPLCDSGLAVGGTWNREGTILFSDQIGQLYQVPAAGGKPSPLWKPDPSHSVRRYVPYFLPDGRHFLYLSYSDDPQLAASSNGVFAGSLSSPESKRVAKLLTMPVFASGHLFVSREGRLLAYPFELRKLEIAGDPIVVAERVAADPSGAITFFSVSTNGLLVYQSTRADTVLSEMVWFDRSGKRLGVIGEPRIYRGPRLAPDGKRVAVSVIEVATGSNAIWLLDASTGFGQRLTSGNDPVWSPEGNRIAYSVSAEALRTQVRVKELNGAGGDQALTEGRSPDWVSDWSRDGGTILATTAALDASPVYSLRLLSLAGRSWTPWLKSTANERDAILSHDGRWAAFGSDESGRYEIYVRAFPGPGDKWQVSRGSGTKPKWRADGKELYYMSPDAKMVAVGINATPAGFEATAPRTLFEAPLAKPLLFPADPFTPSLDGQRFLIATPVGEISSPPLTVVVNWPQTIKPGSP